MANEFELIKERLKKWRDERMLTRDMQKAGIVGNLLEELCEYQRAKNDIEKIDALCDISVFTLNTFEVKFLNQYNTIFYKKGTNISKIIELVASLAKGNTSLEEERAIAMAIIMLCVKEIEYLGYDFYKCMNETLLEIESRTGHYNKEIKKFVKDKGAYSIDEIENFKTYIMDYTCKEELDCWHFRSMRRGEEFFIKKWYKADYENCKADNG